MDGQFEKMADFYDTLPVLIGCLKVLEEEGIPLYKSTWFYKCYITADMRVESLANREGNIPPSERDKVKIFKSRLLRLAGQNPFWDESEETAAQRREVLYELDGKDVSGSSVAEAAARRGALLSFAHPDYENRRLLVRMLQEEQEVLSASDVSYLADVLYENGCEMKRYLELRYRKRRLDFGRMDQRLGVSILELSEIEKALEAFDRFCGESWEQIQRDRYFNYKEYSPGKKDNWYREEDRFFVLRMERDHSISDNG